MGIKSIDDLVSLSLDVSKLFEVDGLIYNDSKPLLNDVSQLQLEHPLEWNFGVAICSPGILHYNHFWYDPGLTSLWSGPIPDPAAPPSKSSNDRLTVGLAVGLTLGLVLVAAILIVVTVKVPAVRHFFQPSTKRRDPTANARLATSEASKSWTRAQTPVE